MGDGRATTTTAKLDSIADSMFATGWLGMFSTSSTTESHPESHPESHFTLYSCLKDFRYCAFRPGVRFCYPKSPGTDALGHEADPGTGPAGWSLLLLALWMLSETYMIAVVVLHYLLALSGPR